MSSSTPEPGQRRYTMLQDITAGANYVWRGVKIFYSTPAYWKYTVVPLFVLLALYLSGMYLLLWHFVPWTYHLLPSPTVCGESLKFLIYPLRWLIAFSLGIGGLLLILTTISTLYEMISAPFFEYLVINVEKREYGITTSEPGWRETWAFTRQTLLFSAISLLYGMLLLVLSWLLPVAGAIFMALVMGYRLGISCLFCSAFNRRIGVRGLRIAAAGDRNALIGFGVLAYLLLLIPFSAIVLLPGFAVGGVCLFNERLYRKSSDEDTPAR
jgi:CysZ protein